MFYGDEKRREMARSILPSTRRVAARKELREVKQRNRRQIREALHRVQFAEDYEADDDVDLFEYPDHKIRYIVRERRDADKLGHFEKWAVEITKDIADPSTRLSFMRSILPKGLIGEHALQHLRNYDEFRTNDFQYGFRRYVPLTPAEKAAQEKAYQEQRHARRVRLLREIVETGWGHRLLNQSMHHKTVTWPVWTLNVASHKYDSGTAKYVTVHEDRYVETPVGPTRARLLTGLGDIETFLRDLAKAASGPFTVKAATPYIVREARPIRYYYPPTSKLPRRTYTVETVRTTWPNPEKHYEWLESLNKFLDAWEEHKGDKNTLTRAVVSGKIK